MPAFSEPANVLSPLFARAGAIVPDTAIEELASALSLQGAVGIGLPLFALAVAVSPGPSNVLLLSAGSRVGVRGGLPLLVGMALGYGLLWGAAGSGLRFLAALDPTVMRFVQGIALTLMAVMAFKLITVSDASAPEAVAAPPGGVTTGLAFQFVNPKAWITAVTAAALFCTPAIDAPGHAVLFGAVAVVAVLLGCGAWLWMGAGLGDVLRRPLLRRATNGVLATMLIGSAVPLLLG